MSFNETKNNKTCWYSRSESHNFRWVKVERYDNNKKQVEIMMKDSISWEIKNERDICRCRRVSGDEKTSLDKFY